MRMRKLPRSFSRERFGTGRQDARPVRVHSNPLIGMDRTALETKCHNNETAFRHCNKSCKKEVIKLPKLPVSSPVRSRLLPRAPCTVSMLDYIAHPRPRRNSLLSTTRRCNPHPVGLAFQTAYNRNNQVSEVITVLAKDDILFRTRHRCVIGLSYDTLFLGDKRKTIL